LLDVLASFRAGEADVLVGTQMLSKGHDFPGVTLVGILQGDHGLGLPDPRAAERTFQLLTQVAGRAGRGDRPGRVVVQAYAVEHPAIVHASRHDFEGFAAEELARRRAMHNPPFGHLALARVVGAERGRVEQRAHELARRARGLAAGAGATGDDAVSVLGPVPSPIERINRRTRWQVLLRSPVRGPLRRVLRGLRPHLGNEGSGTARTTATIDVDPQTLL
jgi:primosomal protein N' (replication factor Y)